ncbi:MAG: PAS domain-containing protein [Desulfurivibrionaceae bacterium]
MDNLHKLPESQRLGLDNPPPDRLKRKHPGRRAKPAILIVDDRQENLLALERLLARTEAVVVKAQNGNDALKASLNHDFALALLDVNMPEMNGYELAALMRGEKSHSAVPIIFVTAAYPQAEQIFQGYSAGAVDYLVKPLREEILLSKVKVFLDIHRRKQDLTHLNAALEAANEKLQAQDKTLFDSLAESTLSTEFLQLVNRSTSKPELLKAVLAFFQQQSGCEAVGLRLHLGEDYPYYETCGFPEEFVRLENSLCERDATGTISRDAVGNPLLACMCGNVIRGHFDPAKPFFTAKGSFWTNNTTQLLATTTDADRQARTRNRCNGEGYQSVALLPLRFGEQRIGLLQLNDRLPDRFTPERLALFERLTDYLAVALEKFSSEESLQKSEERLRLAVGATHAMVYDLDIRTGQVNALQGLAILLGYEPAEVELTMAWWKGRIHPEDLPACQAAFRQICVDHGQQTTQYRLRHKDGRLLFVEDHATLVCDATGQLVRLVGTVVDISNRKRAEEALKQSEALYRSIGEAIDYGVWVCTPDGRNTYASESLLKMVGSTQDQFSNFGWENVLHPDDATHTATAWRECVRTGGKWDTELRFRSIDGQWRHVLARGVPVKNERGEITVWAGINLDITERKKAEEKLREKEKRLALAISATHIGMFDWNLPSNTLLWTQTQEEIFGYAPAATATTTDTSTTTEHDFSRWANRVHPEDMPRVDAEWRRCLREHQPLEVQYRIIWPDGSLHWIEAKGVFLYEQDDTANRMLGVEMDITARKQTEEALRQSRADHDRAQQVGQLGSWRLDVRRNILTWSDENHRIFGVEKGTPLTYESFLKIIHPDDRQYVDTRWQAALYGEPYDIEHRLLVDGQVKWVREKAYLEFDPAGGLLGGFGITQDITERKQAEKALWESEQRYSTLFENMLSGLAYQKILFDDQGSPTDYLFLATNRAFEDHTGLQAVTGKKVTEVIPEIKKSHPELLEIYGRVATTGKPEKFELYFEPFRKWYVVSAYSPKKDHFVTIFDDITERKRAEENLQTMNATLERMVEKRTQELQETQRQLLHQEKLSAIGKLSASIAHEFNNPMQGILSTLKGLRKRAKMDDEDAALLDAAIGEGDRIKNLIRSLQDFNRPSSGKKVMMDLHHSLDHILLLLKSDFNGKRISVVRDYLERLPQIMAVPDQIKQVILNLLTNAADACRQSGGVITLRTWQEGDRVAVAIKDTGVGIKSADLALIFQPFYTTKAEVKGTGLGLSVSYGIVQNHHGEIRVTSLPGEGATFTVLLPITGSKEEAA